MENVLRHDKGDRALYVQIKDIYKEKIRQGELRHGDRIESESEIQKLYGVSRVTARQAILDLEREGMVSRGRGKGTFVSWKAAARPDGDSLIHGIKVDGIENALCTYGAEVRPVRPELSDVLNIPASQVMYCFTRLQSSSAGKLYYAETYYPLDLHLPDVRTCCEKDLLAMAEKKTRNQTARVLEEFGVQIPGPRIRRILCIEPGVPVLTRKRVMLSKDEKQLEMTMCYYRGDLCSICQKY